MILVLEAGAARGGASPCRSRWTTSGSSLATRIVLTLLPALSFDLLWGYSGHHELRAGPVLRHGGLQRRPPGPRPGFTSIFVIVPACTLIGLVLALVMAWFLLLGRYPPSTIFVALGTLTGAYAADRLARGWYYLGGQNGIPSIPPLTAGGLTIVGGAGYYYLALGGPRRRLRRSAACSCAPSSASSWRASGSRRSASAFLGYRVQHFKAIIFTFAGRDVRARRARSPPSTTASSGRTCWACSCPPRSCSTSSSAAWARWSAPSSAWRASST